MEGEGTCQKVSFSTLRGRHRLTVSEECVNSVGKLLSQREESLYSKQKEQILILKVQREFSSHVGIMPLYTAVSGYCLICRAFLP